MVIVDQTGQQRKQIKLRLESMIKGYIILKITLKAKMETPTKVVVTFPFWIAGTKSTIQPTEVLAQFACWEGGTSPLLGEE